MEKVKFKQYVYYENECVDFLDNLITEQELTQELKKLQEMHDKSIIYLQTHDRYTVSIYY